MAEPREASMRRSRGSIQKLPSGALRVSVYAGWDAVTSRRLYLREVIPPGRQAQRKAESARTRLTAQVDARRFAQTTATVNELLDRYLAAVDVTDDVRATYAGYANKHIRPFIGTRKVGTVDSQILESLYAELRRCRAHCRNDGNHDCRPLAAWTVRKIHFIIQGAYQSAIRWNWTMTNPAIDAVKPAPPAVNPSPPTAADAARILRAAWHMDEDWGTHVWLAMTTGARRGELCGLRWRDIDLDSGVLQIIGSKTGGHRRRIALDLTSIEVLGEHRRRYEARIAELGIQPSASAYVFSRDPDHSSPVTPASVSVRYKRMTNKLDINTHLHNLRHYSATELIASGVDVRTVAGRLGHSSAGTTLKVYAAWLSESDQRAAATLHDRMPQRPAESRVRRQSPYEKVTQELRNAILQGIYGPSNPLPPTNRIAAQFNVSIGTAHRAITSLKDCGLIDAKRGVRATVRPEDEWPDDARFEATRLREPGAPVTVAETAPMVTDDGEDSRQLLDLTLVKDGAILRSFSANADPEDSTALRKLLVNAVKRACSADADLAAFDLEVRPVGSQDLLRVFVTFD